MFGWYADTRADRYSTGRPAGTTSPHKATRPNADDHRLDLARQLLYQAQAAGQSPAGLGAQLARHLGVQERTAQRLLNAARYPQADTPPLRGD